MFWFDKENPDVLFADNREVHTTLCDGRELLIKPDINMDFRNMPFDDEAFKIVVFDPPHLINAGSSSWLALKYGKLPKDSWKEYLKAGFDECMRVLGDKRGKTRWVIFMKQEDENDRTGKERITGRTGKTYG